MTRQNQQHLTCICWNSCQVLRLLLISLNHRLTPIHVAGLDTLILLHDRLLSDAAAMKESMNQMQLIQGNQ